ncbi:hypothetical protein PLCT2_02037 [Planctomycetaceae bacterium]|nr:hypothetical protein PLCT2_02037 [Planctomycetaceae bacterium]
MQTATVTGYSLKHVVCEHCTARFRYSVMRQAQGDHVGFAPPVVDLLTGGAFSKSGKAKAEAVAQGKLATALERAVDLVACPKCGKFQAHMIRAKRFKLFKIATLIALLSPWPTLMLTIMILPKGRAHEFAQLLQIELGVVAAIVALVALFLAFRFRPDVGRFFPFSSKHAGKGELDESDTKPQA